MPVRSSRSSRGGGGGGSGSSNGGGSSSSGSSSSRFGVASDPVLVSQASLSWVGFGVASDPVLVSQVIPLPSWHVPFFVFFRKTNKQKRPTEGLKFGSSLSLVGWILSIHLYVHSHVLPWASNRSSRWIAILRWPLVPSRTWA